MLLAAEGQPVAQCSCKDIALISRILPAASPHLPPALLPVTSEDPRTGAALALGPPTHHIFYVVGKSEPAPAWACWLAPRKDLYLQPSREGRTRASWCRHSTCRSQLPGPHEPQVVGPKVVIVSHRVSV